MLYVFFLNPEQKDSIWPVRVVVIMEWIRAIGEMAVLVPPFLFEHVCTAVLTLNGLSPLQRVKEYSV